MHDIMPPLGSGAPLVRSYGPTGFRIGQASYDTHVLVLPGQTLAWGGELSIEAMTPIFLAGRRSPVASDGAASEAGYIELLIIGTGNRHEMIPPALRRALKERGVGVETMDTGAACRTFNILLGEGRRVAAALMVPG